MSPEDRVALILGRAVIRAEYLQAALEEARAKVAELMQQKAEREPASQEEQ